MKTGTYTGTGEERTIDLGFEPKLLHVFSHSGPKVSNADRLVSYVQDNPFTLGNGALRWEINAYATGGGNYALGIATAQLSGSKLVFNSSIIGNRSGETYTWIAIY